MKRAVLFALGYQKALGVMAEECCTPLLRLVDKPIIVHIIEQLFKAGLRQFSIVCHHLPERLKVELGNGERWGVDIEYHLAKDLNAPFAPLKVAARHWEDTTVLLGQGDVFPLELEKQLLKPQAPSSTFLWEDKSWSGWALIETKYLSQVPGEATLGELPTHFSERHDRLSHGKKLCTKSFSELQESQRLVLDDAGANFLFPTGAKKQKEGIWVSPNVEIPAHMHLKGPVFIGENTQLGDRVVLGPYTVVEQDCIIDEQSTVENSTISRSTYVGEGLDIVHSVVEHNLLLNLTHDSVVAMTDTFILAPIETPSLFSVCLSGLKRLIAAFLLLLLSPLLLPLLAAYPIKRREVLRLPQRSQAGQLETFVWLSIDCPWKGLRELLTPLHILRGEAHFVGVPPRSQEQLRQLNSDWRSLYLRSKVGWVHLAQVFHESCEDDELFSAEAYYTANMGLRFDLHVLFRCLGKKLWRRRQRSCH